MERAWSYADIQDLFLQKKNIIKTNVLCLNMGWNITVNMHFIQKQVFLYLMKPVHMH